MIMKLAQLLSSRSFFSLRRFPLQTKGTCSVFYSMVAFVLVPGLVGLLRTHAQHMLSSILFVFPPSFPFSLTCNCKCTPHFLRLVCPCLCHEHTQYWRRGLVNFHASLCKTVTRTLNFLQIRRREGWPRSGLLSRMTPALETGRLTRNDWRCFSTQKCCG